MNADQQALLAPTRPFSQLEKQLSNLFRRVKRHVRDSQAVQSAVRRSPSLEQEYVIGIKRGVRNNSQVVQLTPCCREQTPQTQSAHTETEIQLIHYFALASPSLPLYSPREARQSLTPEKQISGWAKILCGHPMFLTGHVLKKQIRNCVAQIFMSFPSTAHTLRRKLRLTSQEEPHTMLN